MKITDSNITKFFPFLLWINKLKDFAVLRSDIIAGFTVAFVVLPQSMAYAQLAGLPIEVGLYTAFLPVIVASLFGSSRQMATGPVTIVSLMTASALAPIASSGTGVYMVYASLLALFIGVFYLILSSLKLGVIVEFLSHPVIIGFTNAVAIITLTSQVNKIFGVSYDKGSSYFEGIGNLILETTQNIHLETFAFGVGAILGLFLLQKFIPKAPKVLIILIISTLLSYTLGFDGKIIKEIPTELPGFSLPFLNHAVTSGLNLSQIIDLAFFAIIIGLIGFTESISVAKYVGTRTKQRVSANKELYGQGLANIASGLTGGYGVAGSFSKTAVNLRAGAKTGFSGVITGLIVMFSILFLTKYLYYLPMATLAAVIIFAVADLIKFKPIIKAWKVEKHDGFVAMLTFVLTLILAPNIEMGIIIGVLLSLALYIYRSMKPRIVEVAMFKDGTLRDIEAYGLKDSKDISVLRFEGSLYFANAGYFEDRILDIVSKKKKLKYVVIDMVWLSDIDASGLHTVENIKNSLDKADIKILFSGIKVHILEKLVGAGFIKDVGKKYIFPNIEEVLDYIDDKKGKDIDIKSIEDYKPKKEKGKKKKKENIGEYLHEKYVEK